MLAVEDTRQARFRPARVGSRRALVQNQHVALLSEQAALQNWVSGLEVERQAVAASVERRYAALRAASHAAPRRSSGKSY
jgi:hypothetical protein